MKPVQLLIACGAIAYGFHSWHAHRTTAVPEGPEGYAIGDFQATVMPREAQPDTVLIVAPVNCASNAARTKRTNALAAELTRRGIPNMTTMSVSYTRDPGSDAGLSAMHEVMAAGPPIVFVNGLGKANPSPDEVEKIFRRAHSGS